MKILVLNCGSSSVKYKLFNMDTHEVLAQGGVEKLGLPGSFLKFTQPDGKKVILEKEMPEHNAAIEFILSVLTDDKYGCIKSFNEIDAVGHRVVHGGEAFSSSVERYPCYERIDPGNPSGGCVRHCFPSDNAGLCLYVRSALFSV